MTNPWKVRRGIYTLIDDSAGNRKKLRNHLTSKFKEDGYLPKGIIYGKDRIPQRVGTGSQKRINADPTNDKLLLEIKRRKVPSLRGLDMDQQISMQAREGFTKKGIETGKAEIDTRSRIGPITDLEAHHKRMLQMYRPFFADLPKQDQAALADFAFNSGSHSTMPKALF